MNVTAKKSTQHVDFAVSKINKLDNTINHGVTHRDHGVDSTEDQSVYNLLEKQEGSLCYDNEAPRSLNPSASS
jgi:predicted RNA-binding protein (virulence factor B family)